MTQRMGDALHEELAEMSRSHWWYRGRRAVVMSVLDRWLGDRRSTSILEVGAGAGAMTVALAPRGQVTALEPHPGAREHCRVLASGVRVEPGGVDDLADLGPQTYDLVAAFDVIEHLADDVPALRALGERTRASGHLAITVPALDLLWGPHDEINGHYRRYTRRSLTDCIRAAGLRLDYVTYFNTLLFPPVLAVRLARRLVPSPRPPASDFSLPPRPLNALLTRIFASERHLLSRWPLPVGSSLLAIASPLQ